MIIWAKKKITIYYKQKLKEKTIEELENEIKEKEIIINKITNENSKIAKINHEYSNRIMALENLSSKIYRTPEISEKIKSEFGVEFFEIYNQINSISEQFDNEINKNIENNVNLAKTNVFGIDNLIEYMYKKAKESNIDLEIKVNANIIYMMENIVTQKELETVLGDHLKDAIIAIMSNNKRYGKILIIMGIIEGCYEVSIYDTGKKFEINTLLKLGIEKITTHKNDGGSGIGFITTFEMLRKHKGSLIIEEYDNMQFSKSVNIRFDGKNEYKIRSYRADKIRKQINDNRIIIEDL